MLTQPELVRPVLRLDGVTKRFKPLQRGAPETVALRNVTFSLAPGRVLGLVGPDGAGKTTLMRVLAGLAEIDSGTAELMGMPATQLDRDRVGYMPQGGALYHELTVSENLELYARLRGIEPNENPERLHHLYALTGLADFQQRPAGKLSGGMRQKLALACAVVAAPQLMLLDEPSVGVDPVSRREIWQLARELAGPETCIVWATSILDDAELCDELLVLHEGQVVFSGVPEALADKAQGRVIRRSVPLSERRALLRNISAEASVIAAGIEGDGIRVLKRTLDPERGTGWHDTRSRVEDGFALLLDDGIPLQKSTLAQSFPERITGQEQLPSIVAVGLTKRYKRFTAAHDVSFTVRPGEIFGLLGPNGAGKSTTFRMLCGLVRPSSGRGIVAGYDLSKARSQARQAMGYMPQKFSLYRDLTVDANLRFIAGAYGLDKNASDQAIECATQALNLQSYRTTPAGLLPLGIRQRLSLAAAVLHTPPVLFLDEPTSGVDPLLRREFWHHINAIAARGVAVLVTTHFMDEAENCDRLLLINQSEVVAQGTPDELKQQQKGAEPHATLEKAFIALIMAQREHAKDRA